MKAPRNVDDLATKLSQAATAPLVPADKPKSRERGVPIMLRLPPDLHARLDNEAVSRTKETGRGVSVQQVILEKLMGAT